MRPKDHTQRLLSLRMSGPISGAKAQSGVALLTVLFILTLLTTLAIFTAEDENLAIRKAENQRDAEQSRQVALHGEILVAKLLEQDVTTTALCGPQVDCFQDIWNLNGDIIAVEDGKMQVIVADEAGKLNFNNLIDGKMYMNSSTPNAAAAPVPNPWFLALSELFELLLDNPDYAAVVADWVDENTVAEQPLGAEDAVYSSSDNGPYLAFNDYMRSLTEIDFLAYFSDADKYAMLEHVTALPVTRGPGPSSTTAGAPSVASVLGTMVPVNINTASSRVLEALGVNAIGLSTILQQQQAGGFQNVGGALTSYFDNPDIAKLIDVKSNYFSVQSCAQYGRATYGIKSVLERGPAVASVPVISVLSRERYFGCQF